MPTPSRTSLDRIVRAGRTILDEDGLDSLTMQRVAGAVGVRAPSLYKHVRDRAELVRLIAGDIERELGAAMDLAATTGDPRGDLRAIAHGFRAYALAHPGAYALLFARLPDAWRLDPDPGTRTFESLFRTVAALSGPQHVLEAARTVVAWASGFVGMELAGAFRLGGDVDAAFAYGVERIADAIGAAHRAAAGPPT
ncbi:MAG: WHG domain-containing protein [Chloroflexota bacterium]